MKFLNPTSTPIRDARGRFVKGNPYRFGAAADVARKARFNRMLNTVSDVATCAFFLAVSGLLVALAG